MAMPTLDTRDRDILATGQLLDSPQDSIERHASEAIPGDFLCVGDRVLWEIDRVLPGRPRDECITIWCVGHPVPVVVYAASWLRFVPRPGDGVPPTPLTLALVGPAGSHVGEGDDQRPVGDVINDLEAAAGCLAGAVLLLFESADPHNAEDAVAKLATSCQDLMVALRDEADYLGRTAS